MTREHKATGVEQLLNASNTLFFLLLLDLNVEQQIVVLQ